MLFKINLSYNSVYYCVLLLRVHMEDVIDFTAELVEIWARFSFPENIFFPVTKSRPRLTSL